MYCMLSDYIVHLENYVENEKNSKKFGAGEISPKFGLNCTKIL